MIAIGTDLCCIERIREKLNSDKRDSFLKKIYTQEEQELASSYKDAAAFYAGRWAVKEAVAKCLKIGFGKSCRWLDINVGKGEQGQPYIKLDGVTLQTAKRLKIGNWQVSISHERKLAVAFVIAL